VKKKKGKQPEKKRQFQTIKRNRKGGEKRLLKNLNVGGGKGVVRLNLFEGKNKKKKNGPTARKETGVG